MLKFRLCLLLAGLSTITTASAEVVNLSGIITNSCVLTLSTGGALRASASGTMMSSEEAGGVAAVLAMVATGASPTLAFTAPTLSASPVGYSHSPTLSIRYTSLTGANQAYTSSASSYIATGLLDTVTIHARAVDTEGFTGGTYTIGTTVTCQQ